MVKAKRVVFLLLPFFFISITLSLLYRSSLASALLRTAPIYRSVAFSSSAAFANQTQTQPSPPLPASTMSVKATVEKHIADSHVVVFSKSYCPYCRKAKALLAELNEDPSVFELDQLEEGSDWQAYLGDKTGQRTVPSIFIDGVFIGGSSDLAAKHASGELAKLLTASA